MIWFIDEYLDGFLRDMKLCPGVNVNMDTSDIDGMSVCISVFWHSPSLNLDWYPLCQIDYNNVTIFSKEGTEDQEQWGKLMEAAADALAAALTKGGKP